MTNWVLPIGRQQLNSYQLTLSILKTSLDRNNNLIVLIGSLSTLQDHPNLFHVVDNIYTTLTVLVILAIFDAHMHLSSVPNNCYWRFLSDHVSLSCMLSSVPGVCRFSYHLSIFDTRKTT